MPFEKNQLSRNLKEAAKDLRYLLNRGYPRRATLQLVGNRHRLNFEARDLLHRAVFSNADSQARRKKRVPIMAIRGKDLAIDGHNVLITIEAGICGRSVILGDDGYVRDISRLSGNFKRTKKTEEALHFIINALKEGKPRQTLFLLDAPIPMSGKLAEEIRDTLKQENLLGDAMAVKVPERILMGYSGIVATSDTAIINQSNKVLDLAGYIIMKKIGYKLRKIN